MGELSDFCVACQQLKAFELNEAVQTSRHILERVEAAAAHRPDLLLLPECAYPAYYLADAGEQPLDDYLRDLGAPTTNEVLNELQVRALKYHMAIAIGIAGGERKGLRLNRLVMIGADGQIKADTAKHFLWHFDEAWFARGNELRVVEVAGVQCGLFICCDGRMPEVPRTLALKGAELFVDATAWVSSGPQGVLPNHQPDFMMRVRALENQSWFIAANKVGMERDSITYCGKSCILDPSGRVVSMASLHEEELLVARLPRQADGGLAIGEGPLARVFDPMRGRRPALYRCMTGVKTPSANPADTQTQPNATVYAATIQVRGDDLEAAVRMVRDSEVQRAELILLPEFLPGSSPGRSFWQQLSHTVASVVAATGEEDGFRCLWLMQRGQLLATYRKNHLDKREEEAGLRSGDGVQPVVDLPFGRIGFMMGAEGVLPEVARLNALAGVGLLLWPHGLEGDWTVAVARTRATENRIFVLTAGLASGDSLSVAADPSGGLMATTFPGRRQAVAALMVMANASVKTIVPGTDALAHRHATTYRILSEEEGTIHALS